jgi:hypothetical protein
MRRDNHHSGRDTRSVNWPDVAATIEALEKEYGGLVKLTIDREGVRGTGAALWVRASIYSGWADLSVKPTDVCACLWPTSASRTMAGLTFRLLHQLDHAADARRKTERSDLPF